MVLLLLLNAGPEFTWTISSIRYWSIVYTVVLILLDAVQSLHGIVSSVRC